MGKKENKAIASLGIKMKKSNILITWTEFVSRTNIQLDPVSRANAEAAINQCCEVLAVGSDVTDIKPGDFVLMGGAGRLITLNDSTYGIIKEHMVDATFPTMPKIGKDEGEAHGTIRTDITQGEFNKFGAKHKYPAK
jgi:hypothetical protein